MLPGVGEFREADYLEANPDVAAAVKAGTCRSGADHYTLYGKHEKRPLSLLRHRISPDAPNASRRDRLLVGLELAKSEGLEIGALCRPTLQPSEGKVFYVDHADTESLRAKYAADPGVDVEKIVNVDAVWGSQTLQECLGAERKVDYVLASHVIEHVPDLITWLAEIRSVLRPGGSLRLVIPDRRFTFDYLRPESRIYDVLDAYIRRARAPLPRVILENHYLSSEVDHEAAWAGTLNSEALRRHNTIEAGLKAAIDVLINGTYHDTHCWVFTPTSFAVLFLEIAQLGLLNFACNFYFETRPNEIDFIVCMVPSDDRETMLASWRNFRNQCLHEDRIKASKSPLNAKRL